MTPLSDTPLKVPRNRAPAIGAMLRGLRLSSSATRHPRILAVAHGRHASAIRLRCTVAAAPEKIEHDIGASVVDELERLEVLPWYRSLPLRLGGVFSDDNRQAAAASDMYMHCDIQARDSQLFDPAAGGLDDRYYRRVQVKGLHCWMCYARLLQEPMELSQTIRKDMMEKLWEQVTLDLHQEQGMDFITLSKHLKVAPTPASEPTPGALDHLRPRPSRSWPGPAQPYPCPPRPNLARPSSTHNPTQPTQPWHRPTRPTPMSRRCSWAGTASRATWTAHSPPTSPRRRSPKPQVESALLARRSPPRPNACAPARHASPARLLGLPRRHAMAGSGRWRPALWRRGRAAQNPAGGRDTARQPRPKLASFTLSNNRQTCCCGTSTPRLTRRA